MDAMDRTVVRTKTISRRPRAAAMEARRDKPARRGRPGRDASKTDRAASPQPANDQMGGPADHELVGPEFDAMGPEGAIPLEEPGDGAIDTAELELDAAPVV